MVKVTAAAALIISIAALALVAVRPPARPVPPPAAPSSGWAQPVDEFAQEEWDLRLRAVEDNLAHLGRRLTQVEQAVRGGVQPSSGGTVAAVGGDVAAEIRSLREDLNAVATAEALSSDRGREILKTSLRDLQSEIQAERIQTFRERQAQQQEERFTQLVQDARLTGTQERDLRGLLDAESARRAELTERMRQGERDRSLFSELRNLREQNDAQAKSLLSADQYEAWSRFRGQGERLNRRTGGGQGGGRRGGGN